MRKGASMCLYISSSDFESLCAAFMCMDWMLISTSTPMSTEQIKHWCWKKRGLQYSSPYPSIFLDLFLFFTPSPLLWYTLTYLPVNPISLKLVNIIAMFLNDNLEAIKQGHKMSELRAVAQCHSTRPWFHPQDYKTETNPGKMPTQGTSICPSLLSSLSLLFGVRCFHFGYQPLLSGSTRTLQHLYLEAWS